MLAPVVLGGMNDRVGDHLRLENVGDHLRLEDGRDWLGASGNRREHPVELRGVDRGELDHADLDVTAVVHQLCANRLGEALDRMLRAAVGGLQRYPNTRQRPSTRIREFHIRPEGIVLGETFDADQRFD
jgi:hypothetical protein